MPSPCQSSGTRLFGEGPGRSSRRWQLLLFRSFATNGLDATSAPQGQTDTLAPVCWTTASFSASSSPSETQTLSLSMKRISWTSQLL